MKFLTKSRKQKLRVAREAHVDVAVPVASVLNDVRSAFFGLCVNAGKAVLMAMMEQERTALCGPKGMPNATRAAYRGGHTRSQVTLAGQRISIARPRARGIESGELQLPSFRWAEQQDPLDAATIAAMAAGVSTRRYRNTVDPLPHDEEALAISKSAVSRRFVALSSERLTQWLATRLDDLKLPVVMIDGVHFTDRVVLVALGFDAEGRKRVLGIREGSSGRTRAWCARSSPISLSAALTPTRRDCGSSTGRRHCAARSTTSSAPARSCSAARSTSGATSSIICPSRCTRASGAP